MIHRTKPNDLEKTLRFTLDVQYVAKKPDFRRKFRSPERTDKLLFTRARKKKNKYEFFVSDLFHRRFSVFHAMFYIFNMNFSICKRMPRNNIFFYTGECLRTLFANILCLQTYSFPVVLSRKVAFSPSRVLVFHYMEYFHQKCFYLHDALNTCVLLLLKEIIIRKRAHCSRS